MKGTVPQMKTMVLSDEVYVRIVGVLERSKDGAAILDQLRAAPTPLPSADVLHRHARARETPPQFALVRDRMTALTDAAATTRDAMHELIRHAHREGIGTTALARWSGYTTTHIYGVLEG